MATFDQLSAEQRAIIELVLQRGRSYPELADMLGMAEGRVRELAREALVTLAPITSVRVEQDWRGQIADYVLGQQSGPESTATRGHLRRSEPGRAWARSLLDSLETLYADGAVPTVPEGERRPRERRRREEAPEEAAPGRELSPEARRAVRRRRVLAALALAAVAAAAVLVWPVGVLTGDDEDGETAGTPAGQGQPRVQGQVVLRPVGGGRGAGIAVIAERGGQRSLIVQAANLQPTERREAYEVWLYNSPTDARSVGAQVTDRRGTFQGAAELPSDIGKYRFVDVSREPINDDRKHSGRSVLRGQLPQAG
jgi:hypothetical protein